MVNLITDLVWIDQNIQNIDAKENISFLNEKIKNFGIKVARFIDVNSGIQYISNIAYKLVLIIVSGNDFPLYCEILKKYINVLTSIPKTIIFTLDKNKFKEYCPIKEKIGNEFYNIVEVAYSLPDIEKFLEKYLKIKSSTKIIKEIDKPDNYDECYSFEYIKEDSQLIYPSIYNEIISNKEINSKEFDSFNNFLNSNFGESIFKLIEPLKINNKIPSEILSKFYVYAYTLETPFYYNLNRDLMLFKGEKYYPFIKTLYQGMNYYHFKDIKSKLYRRARMSESEINKLKQALKNKDKYNKDIKIPKILFYSRTFLSFSKRKEVAMGFNGNVLLELQLDYLNLDEIQSNSNIKKFSRFSEEEEILFYPFSSFSIENMTEENGLIKIVLVSLGKYKEETKKVFDKYKNKDFKSFQKQASNTDFYKMINKTNYIKPIDALQISYTKITEKPFNKKEVEEFINEKFDKEKFKIGTETKEIREEDVQYEEREDPEKNNDKEKPIKKGSKIQTGIGIAGYIGGGILSFFVPVVGIPLVVSGFANIIAGAARGKGNGKQKRKVIKRREYMVYYDKFTDGTSEESYRKLIKEETIYGNWENC